MELPTRSLVLRVCQFRHDRINETYYTLTLSLCQLIFIPLFKVFEKLFLCKFACRRGGDKLSARFGGGGGEGRAWFCR
jgi:hypothetical protein